MRTPAWCQFPLLIQGSRHEWTGARVTADPHSPAEDEHELPVQHPSKYFLTISLDTARDIGITLPQVLMKQADSVL